MPGSGGEIPEGHPERAADPAFEAMYGAGEAIRRKPFGEGIRLEERSIDFLRLRGEHPMQAHGIGHDRPPPPDPSASKIAGVGTISPSLRAVAAALCMLLAFGALPRATS